ncbi:M16 family metallopeptidase [Shewanella maritima]|uniref:M16 family metallopeptidase n=1 Tax=Shewanella maritima TaxID=2520507 RepID=UPI001F5F63E6|nr:pitrilysin family protein [Shewanella maritima]
MLSRDKLPNIASPLSVLVKSLLLSSIFAASTLISASGYAANTSHVPNTNHAPNAKSAQQCQLDSFAKPLFELEQNIEYHQLENGLRVRLLPQPQQQTVNISTLFNVGSRNEPQGQTGYAHLFEHLLFKGSENLPGDGYAQQMNRIGARFNASTFFDFTRYYAQLPKQALALGLYLEADRLRRPVITEDTIANQQGAVLQEMAGAIDNQPYVRQAMEYLLEQVKGTPYGHAVIGSKADLMQADKASLMAFHQHYYRPDYAQMTLIGALPDNTLELIEHEFADWQKSTAAPSRFNDLQIDAKASHGSIVDERGPWPAVLMAWHTVGRNHQDAEAIALLNQYLFQQRDSLLARRTTRAQQTMLHLSYPLALEHHGVANIVLVPRANESLDELATIVETLIDDVVKNGISEPQLCNVKAAYLETKLAKLASPLTLANMLSNSQLRDKRTPLTSPWQRTNQVTSDDMARVAAKYYQHKAVRLDMLPAWYIRSGKTLLEWLPKSWSQWLEEQAL